MWCKIKNDQVELYILAKPNAKRTMLLKISEQELHIALHAKPQDDEANKELISYLFFLFICLFFVIISTLYDYENNTSMAFDAMNNSTKMK